MALDYAATAALMSDAAFRGRTEVACLKFATYILDEPANIPAHATRTKWAQMTTSAPSSAAAQVMPVLVMDVAVQEDGADITDADLQTAVEASVNKII